MHFIQKHILDSLRIAPAQHYAELKTSEIESGHFRYHLQQLMRDGYVQQLERGLYGLTSKGLSYVDTLSTGKFRPETMPKVITYTLLREGNTIFLQKKPKQPYMGLLNMPGGKVHYGETTAEAARREVQEKAGVTIREPTLAGIFEVQISAGEELVSHVIAYTYIADIRQSDVDTSKLQAVSTSEVDALQNAAPDFLPIYQKISSGGNISTASLRLSYNPTI